MSLATVCRAIGVRAGIGSPPNVWWGNLDDDTAAEIVDLAAEALATVVQSWDWQALLRTRSETLSGAPEDVFSRPADYGRMVPDTMRTANRMEAVEGPISEAEYEFFRQGLRPVWRPVYREANNQIFLLTAGVAGPTLTYRYITANAVQTASGVGRPTWGADDDVALVPERLVTLLGVALWRDSKGMQARVAFRQYETEWSRLKAHDRPHGIIALSPRRGVGGDAVGAQPGVIVLG